MLPDHPLNHQPTNPNPIDPPPPLPPPASLLLKPLKVGPIVNYYQADGAKQYLRRTVESKPSLAVLSAFEGAFTDGPVQEWSDEVIEAVVRECIVTKGYANVRGTQDSPLQLYTYPKQAFGSLCFRQVNPSKEEELKALRSATLLRIMQAAVSHQFSVNRLRVCESDYVPVHGR